MADIADTADRADRADRATDYCPEFETITHRPTGVGSRDASASKKIIYMNI